MSKLRPCPFCGNDKPQLFGYREDRYYQCKECGCIGPTIEGLNAKDAWNKRSYSELIITQEAIDNYNEGE